MSSTKTVIEQQCERAAALVRNAEALVIAAGAGIGVDSGLPDFRSNNGFWRSYPALATSRVAFEEIASPSAFEQQPRLAWGFYGHRLQLYRDTQPHAGFAILQRWLTAMPAGGFVFTSNVDGQFQRAGFASEQIHECHGSIHHLQCSANWRGRTSSCLATGAGTRAAAMPRAAVSKTGSEASTAHRW